ncbi:MAG: creatininase family protein [Chitinophagaceae bacterium]
MKQILILLFFFPAFQAYCQKKVSVNKGVFLENISWTTAKELLTTDVLVVIPLGAGAKEHGPHLPLSSDYIQADRTAKLLAVERNVIITPVVNYGLYPAFLKYPGSTSMDFTTATEMILGIVKSLSSYGPKRFYVINVGVSTTPTLATASKILAEEGILLYYSQYDRPNFAKAEDTVKTQAFGGHANELETSNILYLRPDLVDMSKAVNDSSAKGKQGMILSPVEMEGTAFSPTGIVGYAALATKEKGKISMKAFTKEIIKEIDSITTCLLPQVKNRTDEYKQYEGEYASQGRKNIIIQVKENHLQYKLADAPFFAPFFLYRNSADYFSAQTLAVLFVKNEEGQVVKAWCQSRGESFWMAKNK